MNVKYSLDHLLKIRHDKEDKRLSEMAKCQEEYIKHIEQEEAIKEEIEVLYKNISNYTVNSVRENMQRYQYLERLRSDLIVKQENVEESKAQLDNKRQEYLSAQVDRKTIEKHKEKYTHMMKEKLKKAEERLMNEVAITSYNNKINAY